MARKKSKQDTLIDKLLQDCRDPQDILGKNGLVKQLTKRLVERPLEAELTNHLGYEPNASQGRGSGNSRNGKGQKTVQSDSGEFAIAVPRDRHSDMHSESIRFTSSLLPPYLRKTKVWKS